MLFLRIQLLGDENILLLIHLKMDLIPPPCFPIFLTSSLGFNAKVAALNTVSYCPIQYELLTCPQLIEVGLCDAILILTEQKFLDAITVNIGREIIKAS